MLVKIHQAPFFSILPSFGGSTGGFEGSGGGGITIDDDNAYVAGTTGDSDFPTTAGAYDQSYNGGKHDAFVAKLNATGSALLYSTFLGGKGTDQGYDIALDSMQNAYLTG